MRQHRSLWVAAALLLVFLAQLMLVSAQKSPVWDEPGHIASGVAFVQNGALTVNPQHPPLIKALSGLALTLAGGRWPATPEARDLLHGDPQYQWVVGSAILITAGVDRAVFWARLPMMLIALLGGALVYLWGRKIAGEWAAICALGLYTLDPVILGHGYLVTMDVGLGVFTLLFLFCLWNYLDAPSRRNLVLCGVSLGALLCTKFSAVVMIPVAIALMLAANRGTRRGPALESLLWMGLIAVVTVQVIYLFHGPFAYLQGMRMVNADHQPDYLAYLHGDMQPRFTGYFAAAYFLKEPLASIVLAIIGAALLWRSQEFALRERLFFSLPPAVLFAAHVWKADNLGVRYIIPCLPFAHLLGGIALAALLRSTVILRRAAGVALAGWVTIAAAGIYPDNLSYFNESACLLSEPKKVGIDGGSRCGVDWLNDSNLDWGGSLKQLKAWLDANAKGRRVKFAYFGSFPPDAYGIAYDRLDPRRLADQPAPGLYAISAHYVAYTSGISEKSRLGTGWLRQITPVAVIGHGLYLYDIPAR